MQVDFSGQRGRNDRHMQPSSAIWKTSERLTWLRSAFACVRHNAFKVFAGCDKVFDGYDIARNCPNTEAKAAALADAITEARRWSTWSIIRQDCQYAKLALPTSMQQQSGSSEPARNSRCLIVHATGACTPSACDQVCMPTTVAHDDINRCWKMITLDPGPLRFTATCTVAARSTSA